MNKVDKSSVIVNATEKTAEIVKNEVTPNRKPCHLCQGRGYFWRGEDTIECTNPKCSDGWVMIEIRAK